MYFTTRVHEGQSRLPKSIQCSADMAHGEIVVLPGYDIQSQNHTYYCNIFENYAIILQSCKTAAEIYENAHRRNFLLNSQSQPKSNELRTPKVNGGSRNHAQIGKMGKCPVIFQVHRCCVQEYLTRQSQLSWHESPTSTQIHFHCPSESQV